MSVLIVFDRCTPVEVVVVFALEEAVDAGFELLDLCVEEAEYAEFIIP